MVFIPFYIASLSCPFATHFLYSMSYLCFQWSLYIIRFQKKNYCLFFSQCRFTFSMTFLILYGQLCNYFILHDALRAIIVRGKFESKWSTGKGNGAFLKLPEGKRFRVSLFRASSSWSDFDSIFLAQTSLARFNVFVQWRIVLNRVKSDNSGLKCWKSVRENNLPKFLQI